MPVASLPSHHPEIRVSVVLATFNGAGFLEEQLGSLAEQRRLPNELIVVDDASTDRTVEIVERFAKGTDFPVDVIVRDEHLGTGTTFEEGLRRASGDILFICDQDDRWHPDKIQVMLGHLVERPEALLAFSDTRLIDADGRQTDRSRWWLAGFGASQQAALERDPFGQMLARQIVAGCTVALRAELVPAVLPFPQALSPLGPDMLYDRWMSLVASAAAPVLTVDLPLIDYRIHRGQQIGIPGLAFRRRAPRTVLHLAQFRTSGQTKRSTADYLRVHMEEIQKRLATTGLAGLNTERAVQAAQDHLSFRKGLDPARWHRVGPIIRHSEDPDGYRRFALGAATGLADLIR